jgi:mannose-6-phosphate isomerase-like protein (cupin superfamily)
LYLTSGGFLAISSDTLANQYWQVGFYPSWCDLNVVCLTPEGVRPWGPEPHFHDVAEYWLFLYGLGEIGLGARRFAILPNTVVYTPPRVVHRFHTFTPARVVAVVGKRGHNERAGHLWSFDPERGQWPAPAPRIPAPDGCLAVSNDIDTDNMGGAFVIAGPENSEDSWNSEEGPLRELRCLQAFELEELRRPWNSVGTQVLLLAAGTALVEYEQLSVRLCPGDEVVLQDGTAIRVDASPDAVVVRASQRS